MELLSDDKVTECLKDISATNSRPSVAFRPEEVSFKGEGGALVTRVKALCLMASLTHILLNLKALTNLVATSLGEVRPTRKVINHFREGVEEGTMLVEAEANPILPLKATLQYL